MPVSDARPVHTTQTPITEDNRDLFEGPRVTSDGFPIIEVQRGQAPAPNPLSGHKLVDFKFLQMILLGDREGTVRYRCARFKDGESGERCWRDDFDNPRSAVSHINSHSYVQSPQYPLSTLRLLTRLMRTFKAASKRNYATLTAEELNRIRVPTLSGEPWNAMQVSALYGAHASKFRTPLRQEEVRRLTGATLVNASTSTNNRPKESDVPTPAANSQPAAGNGDRKVTSLAELDKLSSHLVKEAASLFDLHKEFAASLAEFVELVGQKLAEEAARTDADPIIVEKAKKWDKYLELRQLIES